LSSNFLFNLHDISVLKAVQLIYTIKSVKSIGSDRGKKKST